MPGPSAPRQARRDELDRFSVFFFFLLVAVTLSSGTAAVLLLRNQGFIASFDTLLIADVITVPTLIPVIVYFGVLRHQLFIVQMMRLLAIGSLVLQTIVLVSATILWLHYGIRNSSNAAVDCFFAAWMSVPGMIVSLFCVIRGKRHSWFAVALQAGYLRSG
ncbi:hypothetical protein ACOSOMT5_P2996 [Acidiphilium sp. MT5]